MKTDNRHTTATQDEHLLTDSSDSTAYALRGGLCAFVQERPVLLPTTLSAA